MPLVPFNGADPSSILAAIWREVSPEGVISLQLHCDARSADPHDNWLVVQQVLSKPAVYEAFGISSIPRHFHFDASHGLEVIGTVANLLNRHSIHGRFVEDFETAISEARRFLDVLFLRNYFGAVAYSSHAAWCDWFIGDGILDETVLVRSGGNEWWLLAVTDTD